MQHIFKLVNNLYVNEFSDDMAASAFHQGRFFVKVDGANHMIVKESDAVELYARYDVGSKEIPADCISIPAGRNGATYESRQKVHTYCYKPTSYVTGKLATLYDELRLHAAEYVKDKPSGHYSVEVVGRKFQRTPGVDCDGALAIHSEQVLDVDCRSFEAIKRFLLEVISIEGVVVEHKGQYWKIRSNCFDKDCPFEKVKRGKLERPINLIPPRLYCRT